MPFSESDKCISSLLIGVMQALDGEMSLHPSPTDPFHFFIHVSSPQAGDSSPWLASGCPGDNAVNAQDHRARKSSEGRSCEGDEEGHLVYHVGLVMKERCTYTTPGSRPPFCPCPSVRLQLAATCAKLAASTTDFKSLACGNPAFRVCPPQTRWCPPWGRERLEKWWSASIKTST